VAYCTLVQATSRDALAEAARSVLAEKGYDAATVREVATAAGVPQGLIHYYYGGKDGLLAEVLIRQATANRAEQEASSRGVSAPRLVRSALERRRRRVIDDPGWHRLRFELFALGLRKPEMTPRLAQLLEVGRAAIAGIIGTARGRSSKEDLALASVILACVDGLALQKLADPSFDLKGAYAALEKLIKETIE